MRVGFAAALAVVLAGCWGGEGSGETDKERPVPVSVVETAAVGRGDVRDLLVASATVEARASADLAPSASGLVTQVMVDVGDPVRKGQTLAVLDNVSLDAGAEVAEAEVAQLTKQLAETERLFERGAVSERDLDDLRYRLETARTRAREASRSASETRLTAPFSGVVASRDVRVGELASSAKRLFQIVDLSTLEVRARLPERDIGRVAVGQRARLVGAYDEAVSADARVTRIAPVIDPTSGTFEVNLTLDPGQSTLRPGQYVSVELEVGRHEDVLVVPKDAVVYDNGLAVVYRVGLEDPPAPKVAEGETPPATPASTDKVLVARRVPVALGLSDPEQVELTGGVAEGDEIVVVGQTTLRDGARVRRPDDDGAGAAVPAPPPADAG